MPYWERTNSPEHPLSEHHFISHIDLDLYELLEEQQVLLDIIAREQERLEHLEMRQLLWSEPVIRMTTPLPEPLSLQLVEIYDEPQSQMTGVPEAEPHLMPKDEALDEHLELLKFSEMAPALQPTTSSVELQMDCPIRVVSHQNFEGAKCTPPKRNGLGYDTRFPYPKRLGRSCERRALYIFTLCEDLVLQLQHHMNQHESGELNSLMIAESEAKKQQKMPLSSDHGVGVPTGALPKSKFKRQENSVKRLPKPLDMRHTQKTPLKTSSSLESEIDLDCEFGMEHIEKFRYNCVREDQENRFHSTLIANEPASLGRTYFGNMMFAAKLSEHAIGEDTSPQTQQLQLPSWYENGSIMRSLPYMPDTETLPFQAASLHSECINLMPSTSAQARATSLAMVGEQHAASSQSTTMPSLDSLHSHSSESVQI
ncbi:uncharacterized protein LOC6564930 isoform X2 [Drosophila grimshawi]|uniref:uncharacterized protein LOC6564930 isoform X2 n=1 Tax=Drosophila grimshawi TaxID=7222 RepID=UPI000C86F34A|nr:uncharacterized protein LOC6564930 isoform X2 [Drosophila grimshawi]